VKSLILAAHGSRREASNQEVRDLTAVLAGQAAGHYELVRCAFLELGQPSIPEGIGQAVRDGAREVVVVPYFLSAGRHVAEDIPRLVAEARAQHPGVTIRVTPYLGAAAGLGGVLLAVATGDAA
jgi:sirohydrochlorin ferrochelatase